MSLPGWFLLAVSFAVMILLVSSIMWQMQSTLMLVANANTSSISKSNFRSVQADGASLQLPERGSRGSSKIRDPTSLESEYALTPDQLEVLLRQRDQPSVVAYFAPWCGHCQHFIPKYIQFADQHSDITLYPYKPLSSESSSAAEESDGQSKNAVVFGTVNCVTQRELCDRQVQCNAIQCNTILIPLSSLVTTHTNTSSPVNSESTLIHYQYTLSLPAHSTLRTTNTPSYLNTVHQSISHPVNQQRG